MRIIFSSCRNVAFTLRIIGVSTELPMLVTYTSYETVIFGSDRLVLQMYNEHNERIIMQVFSLIDFMIML